MAREIRAAGQDAIFAPTPPLESLRMVLSMATTKFRPKEGTGGLGHPRKDPCWDPESEERTQVLLIDISRAYFNAKTNDDEPVYVQFPPEVEAPAGMCGLLRRHMYGTRRAAEGWQDECSGRLRESGFVQ